MRLPKRVRTALGYLDPFLVRVRVREMQPAERARMREVAAAQDLEPMREFTSRRSPMLGPRRSRSVWAVGMVRGDADIIGCTIRHLVDQGVDRVLLAANLCSDATWCLLSELASELPVTLVRDDFEGFYQAVKVTRLARAAAAAGAEWVVPFDADELWFGADASLRDTLLGSRAPILHARLWNYLPSCHDDLSERDPTRRIEWRETIPATKTKVAFRAHSRARLRDGNHYVTRPGGSVDALEIAHFPYRSEEQFVTKLRQGQKAVASTDLDAEIGRHWRLLGSADDERLHSLWQSLLRGDGLPDDAWVTGAPLVHDPVREKRAWR
jgi:hypothetical protein